MRTSNLRFLMFSNVSDQRYQRDETGLGNHGLDINGFSYDLAQIIVFKMIGVMLREPQC